jgi:hypothetical protein
MATNITAITDTLNVSGREGARQFQALFKVIPFTANIDDDSLAAQVAGQCDITVTGAALGDIVLVGVAADLGAQLIQGYVSAANVVTLTTFNVEGTDADTSLAGNQGNPQSDDFRARSVRKGAERLRTRPRKGA